jgi:hypothetical protein
MRVISALAIAGVALLSHGCGSLEQSARVTGTQTAQSLNDHAERVRIHRWADAVWEDLVVSSNSREFSADYQSGFKEGFAEYLFQGGTGEPPLPPARYGKSQHQTPRGCAAIEDWFAGYRHGASVARDGGYDQWVTGPSSLLNSPVPSLELIPDAAPEPMQPVPEAAAVPRFHLKIKQPLDVLQ